jgi:hypothetical protein
LTNVVTVLWRAASPRFDPHEFIRRFALRRIDAVWTRGSRTLDGKVNKASGFNKHIGDFDSIDAAMRSIQRFLRRNSRSVAYLKSRSVPNGFDVGLFLGSIPGSSGISITHEVLALFAAAGVDLEFSLYPTTD